MRIGMMADFYKPRVSGVTNHIALSKRYLEDHGHEVFVFTFGDLHYPDEESNIIRSPGLPVVDTGMYVGLRLSTIARKLIRTMDVVHVHHPFVSGAMAMRYCKPRQIPIVFTNHSRYDLVAQAYFSFLPETFGDTFFNAFLLPFCRRCDLVIAPSEGIKSVLMGYDVNSTIEVVPNGVELAPFQQVKDPVDRSQFGFTSEDVVIAYVGRLGIEKNLTFLLRSFAGVTQAFENTKLLIIGDGPERDNLQDRVKLMRIASRVEFTGMVAYDMLPRYVASADIFATASISEVHPLTIIEAMAAGLPVVGIDSPGITDTVIDGVTGLLSANDLAEFTAKLVRVVTDKELRQAFGEASIEAAGRYAVARTTTNLLTHYQRLLDQSKSQKVGLWGTLRNLITRER